MMIYTILDKITKLQGLFTQYNIHAYIVPSNDKYMSEYTPKSAKRLEYITGFTGSNGLAIIGEKQLLFFTDGRYIEQSRKELSKDFQIFELKDITSFVWKDYFSKEDILAYDPELFTTNSLKNFTNFLSPLQKIKGNLIDQIWGNKPLEPSSKAYLHDIEFAGISHLEKIKKCQEILQKKSANAIVITAPDSVCWLTNLRGGDVEYTPLILCYALLTPAQLYLFIDPARVDEQVLLQRPEITFLPLEKMLNTLEELESPILIDSHSSSIHIMDLLGEKAKSITDPCQLQKACKNSVEIRHAIDFHVKDAVALCEFFAHIEHELDLAHHTEYSLGKILTEFRSKQVGYIMDSFPTIFGFKENSAIIHYKAPSIGSKNIVDDGILLIDSGAQYQGATTDVTRTLIIGTPTEQQKKHYTLVLKGHIALMLIKFPKNSVAGANLDVVARQFLWQDNLDYPHGTGHGVGSFLSVHEGPQSINLRNSVILQPGMILSNEPGYYIANEYGIRIENLMYVKENNNWLEFEALTLVPYEKKLIDYSILTKVELEYLAKYYEVIKSKVYPLLSDKAKIWLGSARFLDPKTDGEPIEKIIKYTKLTKEKIEKLQ